MRTRRMINKILNQNISGWEAFVIGDGCPHFQKMIDSGEVHKFIKRAESTGNKLHCYNLQEHKGMFGSSIYNYGFENAKGKYIIFAGNDDIIEKNHFENYLSEIEETEYDMVYYKTYLAPSKTVRDPELEIGRIGHSEMIIKRSSIGKTRNDLVYASDWSLLSKLLNKGIKTKKAESSNITYRVMHIPGLPIVDTID